MADFEQKAKLVIKMLSYCESCLSNLDCCKVILIFKCLLIEMDLCDKFCNQKYCLDFSHFIDFFLIKTVSTGATIMYKISL